MVVRPPGWSRPTSTSPRPAPAPGRCRPTGPGSSTRADGLPSSGVPERPDPQFATDERTTLVEFLGHFRESLAMKADGLVDEQAATASCAPSILTLTGLVRHMTEVERYWFRRCFG